MREKLSKLEGERTSFTATFERFGEKPGYKGRILKTILMLDVKKKGEDDILTDHLWFNYTKLFSEVNLTKGDVVSFDGRCKEYIKGYRGNRSNVYCSIREDYKISYPSKVKILEKRCLKELI